MTTRNRIASVASVAAVAASAVALAAPAGATTHTATTHAAAATASTPFCGIHWGSLPKAGGTPTIADAKTLRTGHHPCFDRVVIDVRANQAPTYRSMYVTEGGRQFVDVQVSSQQNKICPAIAWVVNTKYRTVPTVTSNLCSGSVTLQTRARLPYRVFTLAGPGKGMQRVVIDVAHQW